MGILLLGSAPSTFNIVLSYEASALSAPQSFRDAMQTAANILMATFSNPVTINLQVGYGTFEGFTFASQGITQTSAIGGDLGQTSTAYATIRAALDAVKGSNATIISLLNNTPAGASLNGQSTFFVPLACEKVLGLNGVLPNAAAMDGAIGVGTSVPSGALVGVALHEMTHAMGREVGSNGFAPLDFGRFTSAGVRKFTNGTGIASYFSIDGGTTHLADYGTSSDVSDFLDAGVQNVTPNTDPFDEHYSDGVTLQTLTAVDIQQMNILGFQ